ncbi:MAG: MarR family transcriptional regulator [Gammaproteobacteria bacterium]|nr:MarR family transcriptional regulator [Gammaproteobacteria bacterium]MBU1442714.1 MarR family transcriptional regulator [Gammaproteobacteria bacterium]MBU2288391.1 MarR family transcriptional regulator [Gammaproteobacteria bacterium]MBU2407717.1 MarR family transcriptional regulator [Gammaproteobacteria bacterium]
MTKRDFSHRFGFLVNEVGRLYGRLFDQSARQQLGLSRAQCRLLGVLSSHGGPRPLSQVELAERLDLTPMGITSLCDRMEAAGWIQRQASTTDRRVKEIELRPEADKALDDALLIGAAIQTRALSGLSADERAQLLSLLRRVHANLSEATER